jgi:hypothetical protein
MNGRSKKYGISRDDWEGKKMLLSIIISFFVPVSKHEPASIYFSVSGSY